MLAHTFRGSSWKSMPGWKSSRLAFERYQAAFLATGRTLEWNAASSAILLPAGSKNRIGLHGIFPVPVGIPLSPQPLFPSS